MCTKQAYLGGQLDAVEAEEAGQQGRLAVGGHMCRVGGQAAQQEGVLGLGEGLDHVHAVGAVKEERPALALARLEQGRRGRAKRGLQRESGGAEAEDQGLVLGLLLSFSRSNGYNVRTFPPMRSAMESW
jgi:hypothetical protein